MNGITKSLLQDFIRQNEIEFSATQGRLCVPIIDRIFRKMKAGIQFAGIKVEGNIVCDGHHRYIVSLLAGKELQKTPGVTTSATKIVDWNAVRFDEDDWDTEAKIKMLNEQDAAFNNIPIKELLALLRE